MKYTDTAAILQELFPDYDPETDKDLKKNKKFEKTTLKIKPMTFLLIEAISDIFTDILIRHVIGQYDEEEFRKRIGKYTDFLSSVEQLIENNTFGPEGEPDPELMEKFDIGLDDLAVVIRFLRNTRKHVKTLVVVDVAKHVATFVEAAVTDCKESQDKAKLH